MLESHSLVLWVCRSLFVCSLLLRLLGFPVNVPWEIFWMKVESFIYSLLKYKHVHVSKYLPLPTHTPNNNSCWPMLCRTGKNCSYFEWQQLCSKFHSCNQKVYDLINTTATELVLIRILPFPPSSLSSWSQFLKLWGPHVIALLPVASFYLEYCCHEQKVLGEIDTEK